jgi:hypothetical protein
MNSSDFLPLADKSEIAVENYCYRNRCQKVSFPAAIVAEPHLPTSRVPVPSPKRADHEAGRAACKNYWSSQPGQTPLIDCS